ncbi:putative transcription factor C3H family [Helianthus anomalus]
MWLSVIFRILLYNTYAGVDPKSILCEFFKAGQCAKGFKCKFSHDLNVQRKGEKIDIFSDKRDEETMEDWDLEMLEKVVASKGKEYNQNKPTDIVYLLICYFLTFHVFISLICLCYVCILLGLQMNRMNTNKTLFVFVC